MLRRCGSLRVRYENNRIDMICPPGFCCWTMVLRAKLVRLLEEYDFVPVLGLLALALANEIGFEFGVK